MATTKRKNPHAVALGRKGGKVGGKVKSEAKAAAARENGKKGGRRKKLAALAIVALVASGCHAIQPSPTSPTAVPSRFSLSTSAPTLFFSGSTLTVTAHVSTGNGSAASNVPVTFSTTTGGTLSAPSAVTNSHGDASVELTADTNVTVSAAATGLEQQHLNIGAVAPFAIVIEPGGLPVYADGWGVTVRTVLNASAASPPRPATVRMSCTATSPAIQMPDPMSGSQWCVFGAPGVYVVTAIAVLGTWATVSEMSVTATGLRNPPPSPPGPLVIAVSRQTVGAPPVVEFTFRTRSVTSAYRYRWSFDDGNTDVTLLPVTRHTYAADGSYTVRVTATDAEGTVLNAGSVNIALNR